MAYTVELTPSTKKFTVDEGENILDAALRQGVNLSYGCRSGACRACEAKLEQGSVEYPDAGMQNSEKNNLDAGEVLLCQASACSDLILAAEEIHSSKEIEIRSFPCRVEKINKLNHDVIQLFLKLPESERMQFFAGQYIDFILKDGRKRSFSLANPPHNDELLELHVRHVDGGEFTGHVFNNMHEKDLLRLEGPLGSFFLREESERPIIFIAGGTGFAPIKGVIEHAIAEGMKRPMHLYWGARGQADLYMHALAQGWAEAHANISYTPVLSDAAEDGQWQGRKGFVHEAVAEDYTDLSAYEVYACGPPPMINAGREAFAKQGLDLDYYYCDSFDYQR